LPQGPVCKNWIGWFYTLTLALDPPAEKRIVARNTRFDYEQAPFAWFAILRL
jgi:hypothetical protein